MSGGFARHSHQITATNSFNSLIWKHPVRVWFASKSTLLMYSLFTPDLRSTVSQGWLGLAISAWHCYHFLFEPFACRDLSRSMNSCADS
ncbi:hypothetical protein EJ04DRAFT_329739 [Polyplosphaeria fusca]|uniref:Uncharacterized protein n=1 Tax=Polyplosphaeria fusca TaxID=682080 RepID=A0A9P4V7Q2_9PLEO|nr:hypothetical protein EJ04DRAFT_329739 [Polyplosphaeria fusca]